MKLELKILWFDDQPNGMESYKKRLQDHLRRKGFDSKVTPINKVKDLNGLLPSLASKGEPDLIFLDWNMGNGIKETAVNGATIAKALRRRFKYQDIVFYSAAPPGQLRAAVYKQSIDGVFCVHRDNLGSALIDVVDSMLRKVLDINQMRGIVMSHVSEFDVIVSDCLIKFYEASDESLQKSILQEFHENIKKFHEKKLEELGDNFEDHSLEDYEKWSVLNLRYQALRKFLKENSPDTGGMDSVLESLDDFEQDVLGPRNALAHAKEKREKGKVILTHKSITYDDRKMAEIRQSLMRHKDNFENILEAIQCGVFTQDYLN